PPPDVFEGVNDALLSAEYRRSHTRFGSKYEGQLKANSKISLYLNANVIDIQLDASLRSVQGIVARTYSRDTLLEIKARQVVLCMGGLENARILLNANRQLVSGIGNQHDLVGRYFSEHPDAIVGRAILAYGQARNSYYLPSRRLMSEHRCLNFRVEL